MFMEKELAKVSFFNNIWVCYDRTLLILFKSDGSHYFLHVVYNFQVFGRCFPSIDCVYCTNKPFVSLDSLAGFFWWCAYYFSG